MGDGGCTGKGFVKGQSGNPHGKPKMPEKYMKLFRGRLTDLSMQTLEAILDGSDKEAKVSDKIKAIELTLNRAWGMPKQDVTMTGSVANIDTSKLSNEKQEVLLDVLTGVFTSQVAAQTDDETDNTD